MRVRDAHNQIVAELVRQYGVEVRLHLVLWQCASSCFDIVSNFVFERGNADGDRLQVFDRERANHAYFLSQLFQADIASAVDKSHDSSPSIDTVTLGGLFVHHIGFARDAVAEKSPNGRVQGFRVIDVVAVSVDGGEAVSCRDLQTFVRNRVFLALGPAEDLAEGGHLGDEVPLGLGLPGMSIFVTVKAKVFMD